MLDPVTKGGANILLVDGFSLINILSVKPVLVLYCAADISGTGCLFAY